MLGYLKKYDKKNLKLSLYWNNYFHILLKLNFGRKKMLAWALASTKLKQITWHRQLILILIAIIFNFTR